jgi:predicted nucleic acid-binding protein
MKGWRNMKLMIDTNIVIDFLANRAKFADEAEAIIEACADGEIEGVVTASAATDIYYIMRKIIGREKALENLSTLFDVLTVAEVGKKDLLDAMRLDFKDFEDALVAVCAKRIKADFIITRNLKDFRDSPVLSISPKEVVEKIGIRSD